MPDRDGNDAVLGEAAQDSGGLTWSYRVGRGKTTHPLYFRVRCSPTIMNSWPTAGFRFEIGGNTEQLQKFSRVLRPG
jgi:hypothetical protein